MGESDDLLEVEESGAARALGTTALARLQSRAGQYHVLAGPPELVMLAQHNEPPAPPARVCALAGPVRSAGALCDILSFLSHTGWRGELVVASEEATRSIYVDEGYVLAAQSTLPRERLGEVLCHQGVLTREQVDDCGAKAIESGLRFGEMAVKLDWVTRERLFGFMGVQTQEIVFGALRASQGTFYFLEGFDDAELSSRHSLSITILVREGIQRMHEIRHFVTRIPSEQHVPMRTAMVAPGDIDARNIYEAIDGERSVAGICRVVGAGEFEVTRALFRFTQSGHVVIKPPRLTLRAMVEVFNETIAFILRELDAVDQGDVVRSQLALHLAKRPKTRELLQGAGPADDGRMDPARVETNLTRVPPAVASEMLARELYDYASYAMFLARPQLRRMEERGGRKPRFSIRVSAMLEPIAPRPPERPEPAPAPKPGGK
jgi:hypothetical protein